MRDWGALKLGDAMPMQDWGPPLSRLLNDAADMIERLTGVHGSILNAPGYDHMRRPDDPGPPQSRKGD